MNKRLVLILGTLSLAALTIAVVYVAVTMSSPQTNAALSPPRSNRFQPLATAPQATQESPRGGSRAPAFTAPKFGGGTLRLTDFRGKGVVLNFFASWCVPCRLEARDLEAMYQKYRTRGVVFLGVNVQEDTWDDAYEFLRRFGLTYPAVRDATGEIARKYRLFGLPTTYFIDNKGVVRSQFAGGFLGKEGLRELERRIREIVP